TTLAYIQLLFAYGLARVGARDSSTELAATARQVLEAGNEVHQLLLQAFVYRIKLARDGRKNAGPLPPDMIEAVKNLSREDGSVIDRIRHHLKILEPDQKVEPYQRWVVVKDDAVGQELREAVLL